MTFDLCPQVDDLSPLCRLECLHTLSVASCSAMISVGTLKGCVRLQSLNLARVAVDTESLEQLAGGQWVCPHDTCSINGMAVLY